MKIGLYNDSFPPTIDGVANTVINYANNITKNHGKVVVATPKYPNVVDDYPFEVFRYSSVPIVGPLPYRAGNPFLPTTILELRNKKMDLIHVHSPFASSILAHQQVRGRKNRLPTVFTYHTKYDIDIDKYVLFKKINKMVKRFVLSNITQADEVWTVSEGSGKWLVRTGFQGDYIVMPNGTDFAKGRSNAAEIAELKRIYKLNDEPIFLFVGRMMWYKNIKLIVDALTILNKNGLTFKAIFVGEGPDRPSIEQYCFVNGMSETIIFTGAIHDREKVRSYFSLADLLLFPSTYDTSGLVVKEAAACDCAAILIKDSCASEGVVDGFSGLLASETPHDCARAIADALQIDGFLKKIGVQAGETVYLSWEDAVAKAYKRYEIVVENFNLKNHR